MREVIARLVLEPVERPVQLLPRRARLQTRVRAFVVLYATLDPPGFLEVVDVVGQLVHEPPRNLVGVGPMLVAEQQAHARGVAHHEGADALDTLLQQRLPHG